MVPALHQDLNAADGRQLVKLLVNVIQGQDVVIGVFLRAVESAELAIYVADVGVVDVAVDDVSHGIAAAAGVSGSFRAVLARIGELRKVGEGSIAIQFERFGARDAVPFQDL